MKMRSFLNMLACLFVLTVLSSHWACQSDAGSNAGGTEATTESTAPGSEGATESETMTPTPDYSAQAEKLVQQIDQYQTDLIALLEQANAQPAAAKKNATDFEELVARVEGLTEKSSNLLDDVKLVQKELAGVDEKSLSTDLGTGLGNKLQEHQGALEELGESLKVVEKAVEKLKAANGKRVVLFGE